jgi:hypothetical protein
MDTFLIVAITGFYCSMVALILINADFDQSFILSDAHKGMPWPGNESENAPKIAQAPIFAITKNSPEPFLGRKRATYSMACPAAALTLRMKLSFAT